MPSPDDDAPPGGDGCGPNPTDRAKQGTARSLLCEGQGVPIGLGVAGANVNDRKLRGRTLASLAVERPETTRERPQGLCLDKGYDYPRGLELVAEFGFTAPRARTGRRGEGDPAGGGLLRAPDDGDWEETDS